MALVILLACQVVVAAAAAPASPRPHASILLDPDASSNVLQPIPGAKGKCLDGSPPVIYTRPATNESDRHKWVLYFHGGGWCFSAAQCLERSKGSLGSTKGIGRTYDRPSGVMSPDPRVNPTFATWNHAILWYCDGGSSAGARSSPLIEQGQQLWFQGLQILHDQLGALLTTHGMASATDVLVTGSSAGGLSAFLHADRIRSLLPPTLSNYGVAPVSGFFLNHANATGYPAFATQMRQMVTFMNMTAGLNSACVAAHSATESWRCVFANESFAHTDSRLMVLNSVFDMYQLPAIWRGSASNGGMPSPWPSNSCLRGVGEHYPGEVGCQGTFIPQCPTAELAGIQSYGDDFMRDLSRLPQFTRQGNGAFLHTCVCHCGLDATCGHSFFDEFALNGSDGESVSGQEAVTRWWENADDGADTHTYRPCRLSTAPPYQCNPTCARSN